MSARNFHSVTMVAGIAATALGCYMVSLRVAAERASLEQVETRIVLAQRDIRSLQTEVGTRGRLAQLEKWNAKVLALAAPDANQFLQGSFQLATLARPHDKVVDPAAPMVLASAPRPERVNPTEQSDSAESRPVGAPSEMMHVASYRSSETVASLPAAQRSQPTATKPAATKPLAEAREAVERHVARTAPAPSSVASVSTKVARSIGPVSVPASARPAMPPLVKVTAKPAKARAASPATAKDVEAKK